MNGKALGLKNRWFLPDTGASSHLLLAILLTWPGMLFLPVADARTLHTAIPGAKENVNGEFHIPCFTKANITFVFQNIGYSIRPEDYIGRFVGNNTVSLCRSNIVSYSPPGLEGEWLMGTPFLKNARSLLQSGTNNKVYTVLDWDKNEISFGKILDS